MNTHVINQRIKTVVQTLESLIYTQDRITQRSIVNGNITPLDHQRVNNIDTRVQQLGFQLDHLKIVDHLVSNVCYQ